MQYNTSVFVYIQIRDRKKGEWKEDLKEPSISDILSKPVTTLQYNFYKVQDYMQESMMSYSVADIPMHRVSFIYEPDPNKKGAALSFHLTEREKKDIAEAVYTEKNTKAMMEVVETSKQR